MSFIGVVIPFAAMRGAPPSSLPARGRAREKERGAVRVRIARPARTRAKASRRLAAGKAISKHVSGAKKLT
ncbi:MAG: hypothetical protein ACKO4Q_14105, partial [Planctomycetota bacterium]